MILEQEKICLRPLERGDLEASRRWVNLPDNARDLLRVLPVSQPEQEKWFEAICFDPARMVWALLHEDQHIGNLGLYHIDLLHRRAELWCLVGDESYRGHGLAKQACRLLLNYAFKGLGLNKIFLHVAAGNGPALELYKKLGFVEEGRLAQEYYIEGRYVDLLRMRLLHDEIS